MNFISDCPRTMRSSLAGVYRCDQTKRKDPIHIWGLSTFGTFDNFCIFVQVICLCAVAFPFF